MNFEMSGGGGEKIEKIVFSFKSKWDLISSKDEAISLLENWKKEILGVCDEVQNGISISVLDEKRAKSPAEQSTVIPEELRQVILYASFIFNLNLFLGNNV